ncbi:acetyltransferase (GNAT) family domain-containing protein [Ditylenchus destructor]|uniref:Acetyltransferase (GNAT) family domain-containing protein n=1 Tax=Ditylenchus destructor TaxID=166010 RepID=A0AAD4QX57_9BILA|nr:acetyltransferase (GNAT) family domain-containing protein [Ditylenchus destructor]
MSMTQGLIVIFLIFLEPGLLLRSKRATQEVKLLQTNNVGAIVRLHKAVFPEYKDTSAREFNSVLQSPHFGYGYFYDGKLVGVIIIHMNAESEYVQNQEYIDIFKFGVLPAHRGMGIGQRLMDKAIGKLEELGCHELLVTVIATNPAVRFYRNNGFEVYRSYENNGLLKSGATYRELLMKKSLRRQ